MRVWVPVKVEALVTSTVELKSGLFTSGTPVAEIRTAENSTSDIVKFKKPASLDGAEAASMPSM